MTGRPGAAVARWAPSSGIFAPTTGLDQALFDGDALRPAVREAIMERLGQAMLRARMPGWRRWLHPYLAGGSASEWAGSRPNEGAQDLDVLIGADYESARRHVPALRDMTDEDVTARLNQSLRSAFNESGWEAPFGGTWDVTAYCNQAIGTSGIGSIHPYAAWDLTESKWAVRPPHLPEHTLADFDPAVLAHARSVTDQARAILRMPEPLRTREARDLWEHVHQHRCTAFSEAGEGWQDPGNVDEKWLAYAPGGVLAKIRDLALAPRTAAVLADTPDVPEDSRRDAQLAAMDGNTRASALAQEHVRTWHPRVTLPLHEKSGQGNHSMRKWLADAGVPGAEDSFVAMHQFPDRRHSCTGRGPDGEPCVILHPDRWDYGTLAHETAHLIRDNQAGRQAGEPHGPDGAHDDEWASTYAGLLDKISPDAGGEFLARRRGHLGGLPAHEAATGYTGITPRSAMIYLDLPEGAVHHLEGGVDDHHITVVYLGKSVSDEAFEEATRRTAQAAAQCPPLSGILKGVQTFDPSDASEDKVPAFVPAFIPGIGRLRSLLEDLNASQFRQYRPHVTLAYLEPGDDLPEPHPTVPVEFSHLHIKRGDEVHSFPLGGGMTREAAADGPVLYHGSGKRYREGDLIDPSQPHKRIHQQSDPSKAYFSDSLWNARRWADVASPSGNGHVYEVEPTGHYEEDPHYAGPEENGIYELGDRGMPTRRINAYQTGEPLRVIRRVPREDH